MIRFKSALLAASLLLTPAMMGAGQAMAQTQTGAPASASYQPPPGAVEEYATLRDGTRLAANVFKPAGTGPWPVVVSRTPI